MGETGGKMSPQYVDVEGRGGGAGMPGDFRSRNTGGVAHLCFWAHSLFWLLTVGSSPLFLLWTKKRGGQGMESNSQGDLIINS